MKLSAGPSVPPRRKPCGRMRVRVSSCLLLQMTPHVRLLVLCGLAVSSQLGLEDVFFSPEDQTVTEGGAAFLRCVSGESSPPATITWLKDGDPVTGGRHVQGEYGGGNQQKTSATLHLFNVTLEDEGIYVCHTHNALLNISKLSKPAKLTVRGVPRRLRIIQGPENITVAIGTEGSMRCIVGGFPVPMVHWFKDGWLLANGSSSIVLQNKRELLTFRNVSREDEGFYHCEASNRQETVKSQQAFLHPADMDWSFVQQPSDLTVRRGDDVTLTCRPPYSRPAAWVSWFRDNQLLNLMTNSTVLSSGDLFIHSVQEDDSGSYFCRASNLHLQRFLTSRRATLTVLAPPTVTLWPQVLTVAVGARVVLECHVSGHPLPSISWVKRGSSKQTGGRVTAGRRNATLRIQAARSYDEGVYVCEASNALGQSRSSALLRVAVSPVIVTFVGQLNCRVGAPAVLPCRAVGIQPITYTWTRGRADTQLPVLTTEGKVTPEGGALYIPSVQHSDAGEYHCTAENRVGRHQRHSTLTITAEDAPVDGGRQTGLVLSARSSSSKELTATYSNEPSSEQFSAREGSHEQAQYETDTKAAKIPTISREAVAELKMPSGSLRHVPQHIQIQPAASSPAQPFITRMQPPILPPPPHPHFQSPELQPKVYVTRHPLFTSPTQSPSVPLGSRSAISGEDLRLSSTSARFQQHASRSSQINQVTETLESSSKLSEDHSTGSLRFDPNTLSATTNAVSNTMIGRSTSEAFMVTSQGEIQSSQAETRQPVTLPVSPLETTSLQTSPQQKNPSLLMPTSTRKSPVHSQHSSTVSFIPKFHLELSTIQFDLSAAKPTSSSVKPHRTEGQAPLPPTETTSEIPRTQTEISPTRLHRPPSLNSSTWSMEELHPVNQSDQLNDTRHHHPVHSDRSANDTELTDWPKRNTTQSPMTSNDPSVTQQPSSWFPVLSKHDIPIVVGVGVSLAFIFITVTFYSVVQKNELAPPSRAAQRHLGVPQRHAERRSAGRTYENRAFEDDECVAVIEQSPNTSDTRARPPGPSLVTVQVEPTFEDRQEDAKSPVDNQSVTVETYPEPIVDTKVDPSLEEGCSLSQPSIQLHSADDWTSTRDDDQSRCHDALPPPSSLPSPSPSPSPPSRREEALHSSLTLHSSEPCAAPLHHSLSISRGNPPLLLTHHVSMGRTTVAVDVHFYPAAAASMTVGGSTHVSSVSNSTPVTAPLFGPPLAASQDNHQSTAMFHSTK